MPTICRDNVVIISVMFLQSRDKTVRAHRVTVVAACKTGQRIRLGVRPKQAGAENNGHVAGGHLVGILVLAEFG